VSPPAEVSRFSLSPPPHLTFLTRRPFSVSRVSHSSFRARIVMCWFRCKVPFSPRLWRSPKFWSPRVTRTSMQRVLLPLSQLVIWWGPLFSRDQYRFDDGFGVRKGMFAPLPLRLFCPQYFGAGPGSCLCDEDVSSSPSYFSFFCGPFNCLKNILPFLSSSLDMWKQPRLSP